ncbi:MAG: deoxynucleoside kinase [Phycisphaerales bacterium]|jgi:deoxyguanosine kinase|nr:deoxynucleoside kinase [Phycisphaerales bacterium]MBT7171258.1 deoxynucleoside kinase [Phycisphaerales bacterium]
MTKLISIMGPIGVGKTTLAEHLAEELGAELVLEDFAGNPYLADSCRGRNDLILPSQVYFLMTRARQLAREHWDSREGLAVSDYAFCQDELYARLKLVPQELAIYRALLEPTMGLVTRPRVLIHLDAPLEVLCDRIAGRGREFESWYTEEFLAAHRQAHWDYQPPAGVKLLRVNTAESDLREDSTREKLGRMIRAVL